MNEKTINEQYAYIHTLLENKRLKEALMQLESLLWQCPDPTSGMRHPKNFFKSNNGLM